MKLAFYSDSNVGTRSHWQWQAGFWDNIRTAFGIAEIYEIGGDPEDANPGKGWYVVESPEDIPGTRVFFNPADSPTFPGTIALSDFQHTAEVYIFGHDEVHNPPFDCDCVVYIDTPVHQAMQASEAAGIVLYDKHNRGL